MESYLLPVWRGIASSEIWGTSRDWFIGIVAGILGGYITFVLISLRVPRLRISNYIVLNEQGFGRIKVINKRRRWWIWHGDARGLKAELDFVRIDERYVTRPTPIKLRRGEVSVLYHRKRKSDQNDYVFRTETPYDFENEVIHRKYDYIRFRITARDGFSNYEGITEKRYAKEGSRYAKRGYSPLIRGDLRGGGDIRIRAAAEQSRPGGWRRMLSTVWSRYRGAQR